MQRLLFAFWLILFTTSIPLVAQNRSLNTTSKKAESLFNKADEYIRARDFDRALAALNEAVKKDPNFPEAYFKAANLYKMMGDKAAMFDQLQKGMAVAPHSPAFANSYFDVAELYFDRGNYQEARNNYNAYLKAKPKSTRQVEYVQNQLKTTEFALQAMQQPVAFNPVELSATVNAFSLQYFPSTTADQRQLLYTARAGTRPDHDENIYVSQRQEGEWQAPVSISDAINSTANEGAAAISGDGKTLVFTSCNRPDSQGDCDLYISFRTGNDWSKPKNIGSPVNTKAWESQPSLSADGRTLYFTSTRGGGIGKEDIWVTKLNDDGSWQTPVNLGPTVNSSERDMAPFIHGSGSTLYFVSDGHLGLGGLDVFMTSLDGQMQWQTPKNLGYPLNTHADEGSLFISPDNSIGFYSRQEGAATGNIRIKLFGFEVPAEWKSSLTSTYAQGRVFSESTRKPLESVVQVYDLETDSLMQQVKSDKLTGEYTAVLSEGKQYAFYVNATGYMMNSLNFDYTSSKALSPVALDVYLKPIKAGAAVVLNNLFFDTGKYDLNKNSRTELNKLIRFMNQNSELRIEISGHTDDVGSDKDNQLLSERRAKAVADYLTSNGVSGQRLRSKGYGKTKPVKPNTSDENRQLNRRIEMTIL